MANSSPITLAHGNGGRLMRELIADTFARWLGNPLLDTRLDAAALPPHGPGTLLLTTDAFTVQPLEFPGGNIGSLAIHGTVNDLAVAGGDPLHLTVSAIIEEGLEQTLLERLVQTMAHASREAGVQVVAGDTKVVPRGSGGGLYLTTTGLGLRPPEVTLNPESIRAGDAILVSGPVGDHGAAILLARQAFGLKGSLHSDAACLLPLTRAVRTLQGLRFMRDPTRGGVATVAHELAHMSGLRVRLREEHLPVRDPVQAVCDLLGYDPLYLACEGRVVAVVAADQAETARQRWIGAGAPEAALIGVLEAGPPQVLLQTSLGGERLLPELEDDPLPRIC
ncbi:MAG: hydrogenase expression/formation protein HypE [Magnetococcales bacterium]|nr:hydrogenase expression/formation protein HypE [Magnetococcales bacterium]